MAAARSSTRSPFWPLALAGLAVAGGLARWLLQGSGNVYTDAGKTMYVPDPDLGWRLADSGPLWLGLDAVALCGAAAAAVAVGALWVRRRERRSVARSRLRPLLWVVGAVPLVLPAWAFATGLGPDGGRDRAPSDIVAPPVAGVAGSLPELPAGRYEVVRHEGSAVAATLAAGGEVFDTRFIGAEGFWTGDPGDLRQPMRAEVSVDAASADTGIALRSKSARDELQAHKYPRIRFRLDALRAARQEGPREVAFAAAGTFVLMGRSHPVEVSGVLRAPDADGVARLGLAGERVLVVRAESSIRISETAIVNDGTFEADDVPLAVSLVLVHKPTEESP